MARIVLGVSGGIAAYKACSLLRLFTEAGHDVTVVPTASALQFVGAPTWEALSGKPVHTGVWDSVHEVPHVRLGQTADLVVVAPATADLLAKAAHGLAGDLLTNVLLTARCPVVMAPAMHTEMWDHAATQANVSTLAERGIHIIPPASGRLTGADTGPGRLPEPEALYAVCERILAHPPLPRTERPRPPAGPAASELAGRRVVVSPVAPASRSTRCATWATAARASRATRWPPWPPAAAPSVTLVAANTALPAPAGVTVVPVSTALELQAAVERAAKDADVVVMAAAVADFRPAHYTDAKIKKTHDPDRARRRPDHRAGAQPRHPRRAGRGPRRGGQPGHRRVRRRDR